MNIIEAVKSGKPFRRKDWGGYIKSWAGELAWEDGNLFSFEVEDILAEDWEIKQD